MKFGVNKKILLYTAGCVWIFAGINILRIGIVTWLNDTHYWLFKITIRTFHLLPNSFISVFYTGLSTALIITGFLFLRQGKTVGN